MIEKKLLVGLFIILASLGVGKIWAQNDDRLFRDLLPGPGNSMGCELATRYIDDAINRAVSYSDSVFIVMVRPGQSKSARLDKLRVRSITRYLQYRGLKNFEVGVSEVSRKDGAFDFFVTGKLIYSVPLQRGKAPELVLCGVV